MVRELRAYNFLNKMRIGIYTDVCRLDKCEENIEETALESKAYDGLIVVNQHGNTPILRDETYPYLWKNSLGKRTDYYRYSTLVRKIMRHSESSYELSEYTSDNEGVLDTFRNIYCQSDMVGQNALVHASILNIGGRGILIAGPCRSGKTGLTLAFLKQMDAKFVNEGVSLIGHEHGSLQGFYLPRQVYLRFLSISQDQALHPLLYDYDLSESPQYFDHDTLQRIIKAKAFHVDAGITFSRKKIAQIYGIGTLPQTPIHRLVFTEYSNDFEMRDIDSDEALERLRSNEFPLKNTFNHLVAQTELRPPELSQILDNWLRNIRCKLLSYHLQKHLNRNTLEDLLR